MSLRYLNLILIPLILLVGGCDTVTSRAPVGEVTAIDPQEWDGSWVALWNEDQVLTVRVVVKDPETGVISAAAVTERDGKLNTLTGDLYLRRSASFPGYWLVSFRASYFYDKAPEQFHLWYIARRDHPRQLTFWAPKEHTFKALVATGALRGEGDRGADLGELTAEDLELIASHESVISATRDRANPLGAPGQPLFLWHRPMVFIRQ